MTYAIITSSECRKNTFKLHEQLVANEGNKNVYFSGKNVKFEIFRIFRVPVSSTWKEFPEQIVPAF